MAPDLLDDVRSDLESMDPTCIPLYFGSALSWPPLIAEFASRERPVDEGDNNSVRAFIAEVERISVTTWSAASAAADLLDEAKEVLDADTFASLADRVRGASRALAQLGASSRAMAERASYPAAYRFPEMRQAIAAACDDLRAVRDAEGRVLHLALEIARAIGNA